MSTDKDCNDGANSVAKADLKLEAVVIPVSDVGRSKTFYGKLGWRLDADFPCDNGFRDVQFTPPGSGCSVQFGTKITAAASGSAHGLYFIVSDIEAARNELVARGVDVTDVLQETEKRHAEYEPTAPKHKWWDWYAAYMIVRENGRTPDESAKDAALHIEGTRDRPSV